MLLDLYVQGMYVRYQLSNASHGIGKTRSSSVTVVSDRLERCSMLPFSRSSFIMFQRDDEKIRSNPEKLTRGRSHTFLAT